VAKGGWLDDQKLSCGAGANAAKFLSAGFDACTKAVITHDGMGYAREYHVEPAATCSGAASTIAFTMVSITEGRGAP